MALVDSIRGRVSDPGEEGSMAIAHLAAGGAVTVNFLFRPVPADYRASRYTEAMAAVAAEKAFGRAQRPWRKFK